MTPVDFVLEPIGFTFFVRALLASAIVGLVCAVVGSYMVLRGLAFMGDALSHSAFPGVVAAYLLKGPFYIGAAIAAVGTALAIGWVTRRGNLRGDTAIGVLFAGMFALGVFATVPAVFSGLFAFRQVVSPGGAWSSSTVTRSASSFRSRRNERAR